MSMNENLIQKLDQATARLQELQDQKDNDINPDNHSRDLEIEDLKDEIEEINIQLEYGE